MKKAVLIAVGDTRLKASLEKSFQNNIDNIKSAIAAHAFDEIIEIHDNASLGPECDQLKEVLITLISKLQDNDSLFLYLSGHSVVVKEEVKLKFKGISGDFTQKNSFNAFCPKDYSPAKNKYMTDRFLYDLFLSKNSDAHAEIFIDSCFSGGYFSDENGDENWAYLKNCHVWTSSAKNKKSYVLNNENIMTRLFLEGLQSGLSVRQELLDYIKSNTDQEVRLLTNNTNQEFLNF